MGDPTALISGFGATYTVTRYGAGSYVNGLYVSGSTTTFSAVISIQPLKGSELLNLTEAQRTRRWVKGYSDVQLLTARQSPNERADEIPYDGKIFQVQGSEVWVGDLSHWKVLLAEKNPE